MKGNIKLKKIASLFLVIFLALAYSSSALATSSDAFVNTAQSQTDLFVDSAGFSQTAQLENIIATVIKMVLSLLAIVFIVLMIFSGYQWMTAGGNEETVEKAKNRIKNAIIGLIIVVMAFAITAFVFRNLPGGSGETIPAGSTGT